MFTHQTAKAFYDRFGSWVDTQAFYEDPAIDELVAHADFHAAQHVFELGLGTGRLAERLLREHLSDEARYTGIDISTTMVSLARARLAKYGSRVEVMPSDAGPVCPLAASSVDRIVSTYVLDLLPEPDISDFLKDCARALSPEGRVCLVGITYGETLGSRLVTKAWQALFRASPHLVGGCRPIRLQPFIAEAGLRVLHCRVVSSFAIASEVLVAAPA